MFPLFFKIVKIQPSAEARSFSVMDIIHSIIECELNKQPFMPGTILGAGVMGSGPNSL